MEVFCGGFCRCSAKERRRTRGRDQEGLSVQGQREIEREKEREIEREIEIDREIEELNLIVLPHLISVCLFVSILFAL